jgi:hypothetical protein
MTWQGCEFAGGLAMTAVCAMAMLNPGPVYGQGYGQAGPPSIPTPTAVRGSETKVIPSLSLSERYDSNVYFVPGRNLEDYVTTVSPQLRVIHKRQLVEGMVGGGRLPNLCEEFRPQLHRGNGIVDLN